MINEKQRANLQAQIRKIEEDVRGALVGWEFRQCVLGVLFYRFISEGFSLYMEEKDHFNEYALRADSEISESLKKQAIKEKGYFIYPSQLFENVVKDADENEYLTVRLDEILAAIECSGKGHEVSGDLDGIFSDVHELSNRVGNTSTERNKHILAVLQGVSSFKVGDKNGGDRHLFSEVFECLLASFATNAGKVNGDFFTPPQVSKLIARLAVNEKENINKIYDPAAGLGSLLLQVKNQIEDQNIEGYYGQEINRVSYNLMRMNMHLHNVKSNQFDIAYGDTLLNPQFRDEKFDAIVSNPPYSIKWTGGDNEALLKDERFKSVGILPPANNADLAFVLHALNYLADKGRAVMVSVPGTFYRDGREKEIRKYLVDNNYIESIIALPPNLFFGTTVKVNILVLSKNKIDQEIQFINVSGADFIIKARHNNILSDEHINQIIDAFANKEETYISKMVSCLDVEQNDYNLSVETYINEWKDSEDIDIKELNRSTEETISRVNKLRDAVDKTIEFTTSRLFANKLEELISDGGSIEHKKLKDILTLKNGKKFKKDKKYEIGNIPVYGSGGIIKYINESTYSKPSVLIPRKGSIDKLYYVDKPFWNIDTIFYTEIKTEIVLPKYVYHYLSDLHLEKLNTSGGVPSLTRANLEQIEIPVPSLKIQEEIIRILDNYTDLMAELEMEIAARKKQYEYYRANISGLIKKTII